MSDEKNYNLDRFLTAQKNDYARALSEIQHGGKRSHWIWYIFPQLKGLGYSYNAKYYGLDGIDEARAYLAHPVLGSRLREISTALLAHKDTHSALQLMGSAIDRVKLHTCMKLFDEIAPNSVFNDVLTAFYR